MIAAAKVAKISKLSGAALFFAAASGALVVANVSHHAWWSWLCLGGIALGLMLLLAGVGMTDNKDPITPRPNDMSGWHGGE